VVVQVKNLLLVNKKCLQRNVEDWRIRATKSVSTIQIICHNGTLIEVGVSVETAQGHHEFHAPSAMFHFAATKQITVSGISISMNSKF
jgi:hypothetical protein